LGFARDDFTDFVRRAWTLRDRPCGQTHPKPVTHVKRS